MNPKNPKNPKKPVPDEIREISYRSENFQDNVQDVHSWTYVAVPQDPQDPQAVLDQYYKLEEKHCPKKNARANFKRIETALSRHCAIIAASRQPVQFQSLTCLQISKLLSSPTQVQIRSYARARVHTERDITPFTELSVRQMRFVVAHSGLAHLLLKDLAGVFRAKPHTRVAALKRADLIAGFISSALACEYMIGNRYYRNLPTVFASQEHVVGMSNATAPTTPNDATYDKIQETGEALEVLYNTHIDRLEWCVDQ